MALYIRADGSLELRTPPGVSASVIGKFLDSAAGWIETRRARIQQECHELPGPESAMIAGTLCRILYSPHCRKAEVTSPGIITLPERCRNNRALTDRHIEVFCRRFTREKIFPAVAEMAAKTGKKINFLRVSGAVSRWGSCSSCGNINISWRTARLPEHLAELIAAHEAAHLTEMNHSERFYALLDRLVPDRKNRERELKQERYKYADQ